MTMDFNSVNELLGKILKQDFSNIPLIEPQAFRFQMPDIETIDPEDTIMGDIKHKIQEQNELAAKQIEVLVQQNQLLSDNYNKLKDMYDAQERAYQESREDLKSSRIFNRWMMVIAVIAMLAAIASPIVTILVSNPQ